MHGLGNDGRPALLALNVAHGKRMDWYIEAAVLRNAMHRPALLAALALLFSWSATGQDAPRPTQTVKLLVPYLEAKPVIDGALDEWKDYAFNDGTWDMNRIRHTFWYDEGRRNRLTDHGETDHVDDDLRARYYIAWDETYLYFGAVVHDNVNDVEAPGNADRAWYARDSICFFMEAPRDEAPEFFGQGDNAFCFTADATLPSYGAWWRHGSAGASYLEEPIPDEAVDYALVFDDANFVLEARVAMAPTLGVSDPRWLPPQIGDLYGLEIVHCDPDGGPYGGHFMIYGTGDDDATWARMVLVGPQSALERRSE